MRTEAEEHRVGQDRRQDLQRRRQGRGGQRRQADDAVPLQRRHLLRLHGHRHLRPARGLARRSSATPRTSCWRTRRRSSPPTRADVLYIELPASVELEVTYTEPGLQGDRSTGGTKPATLETGHQITVPLFIVTGERDQGRHPRLLLPGSRQQLMVATDGSPFQGPQAGARPHLRLRDAQPLDRRCARGAGRRRTGQRLHRPPRRRAWPRTVPGSTRSSRRTSRAGRSTGCRQWTATSCGWRPTRCSTSTTSRSPWPSPRPCNLVRDLSTDESPAFVNGVLGNIVRDRESLVG